MRNQFLSAGLLVATTCTAPVLAADISARPPLPEVAAPAAPAYLWTGFYTGATAGWAWSNLQTDFASSAFPTSPSTGTTLDGAMFGTQVGYNYQIRNWVLGLEGDFVDTSITGTQQALFTDITGANGAVSTSMRIDWLASIRGRVGYLWGTSLIYVTGGGAWESLRRDLMVVSSSDIVPASFSSIRSGFTVGAGYEFPIAHDWTARIEYLFYDFGNTDIDTVALTSSNVNAATGKNTVNTLRMGANWKF